MITDDTNTLGRSGLYWQYPCDSCGAEIDDPCRAYCIGEQVAIDGGVL